MARIGRNEPCPCGSGRKFKRCCGARGAGSLTFANEDRVGAMARLDWMLEDEEWQQAVCEAEKELWGPMLDAAADHEDEGLWQMSADLFQMWFALDRRLPDGRTPVEHLLAEEGAELSDGERAFLELAARTSMRLYEVTGVERGESVALRDLLSGAELRVAERLGSKTMRRWQIQLARVNTLGASGRPEIERGLISISRTARGEVLALVEKTRERLREEHDDESDEALFALLTPALHQLWLAPALLLELPDLATTDGDPLLLTQVHFRVDDAVALGLALDAEPELERNPAQPAWSWVQRNEDGAPGATHALMRLREGRLVVETLSAERAAAARELVERAAGDAVAHKATTHEHPEAALRRGARPDEPVREIPPDLAFELSQEHCARYYREWLDMEVPALEGMTPRAASRSPAMRGRLVDLLKDFEQLYERELEIGQPGFDPWWLWGELGLASEPEAPRPGPQPPPLAHEVMALQLPGLAEVARSIAERVRRAEGFGASATITQEEMQRDLTFMRFVRKLGETAYADGATADEAAAHANLAGTHLWYVTNYELHHRKTFRVDPSLAWTLGHTRLEVTGDLLRLPFATFAVVFDDRHTLGLAERLLSLEKTCTHRGRMLKVATAYVSGRPEDAPWLLNVSFTFDAQVGDWPYLVSRDLWVRPEAELDGILDSVAPDVDPASRDPIFSSGPLRRLLHIVVNSILYATSAGVEPEQRSALPRAAGPRKIPPKPELVSSEAVYHLPGAIPISEVRKLQEVERAPGGGELLHRFMVRGHWRRAARSYKDQRPRWIAPYWKGPDMAALIERTYRLQP